MNPSLKEVVAIITILLLLICLLIPWFRHQRFMSEVEQLMANGRHIVQAIYSTASVTDYHTVREFQKKFSQFGLSDFESSTEYFIEFTDSPVIQASFAIFGGAGVPVCNSTNSEAFGPENNAWNVVCQQEKLHETAPILFTRNLQITNLSESIEDGFTSLEPFGNKMFVVGGASFAIERHSMSRWDVEEHTNNVCLHRRKVGGRPGRSPRPCVGGE